MVRALVKSPKSSTLGHIMDVLSRSAIVPAWISNWRQTYTITKHVTAASCCHCWLFCSHCFCVQYALLTVTTDWGKQWKQCMFAHPVNWPKDTTGNYAETVAAPRGCSQLLISVCVGLYRPEVRIQQGWLCSVAPPVDPSRTVRTALIRGLRATPSGRSAATAPKPTQSIISCSKTNLEVLVWKPHC